MMAFLAGAVLFIMQ